jgi:hypothetical protein
MIDKEGGFPAIRTRLSGRSGPPRRHRDGERVRVTFQLPPILFGSDCKIQILGILQQEGGNAN